MKQTKINCTGNVFRLQMITPKTVEPSLPAVYHKTAQRSPFSLHPVELVYVCLSVPILSLTPPFLFDLVSPSLSISLSLALSLALVGSMTIVLSGNSFFNTFQIHHSCIFHPYLPFCGSILVSQLTFPTFLLYFFF